VVPPGVGVGSGVGVVSSGSSSVVYGVLLVVVVGGGVTVGSSYGVTVVP